MEKYIVAALAASLPNKYDECLIVREDEPVADTHKRVFGPAPKDTCENWCRENGVHRAEKSMRPKVYTEQDKVADPKTRPDGFLQKIVKYIPSEIVAAYVAIANILQPATGAQSAADHKTLLWVFYGLLILTPIYTYVFSYEKGKPLPIYQTVVAPVAFVSWVIALPGNPFEIYLKANFHPAIGSVILILVLIAIPVVEQGMNVFRRPVATRENHAV